MREHCSLIALFIFVEFEPKPIPPGRLGTMNIHYQLSREESNSHLSNMKIERYFSPGSISTYAIITTIVGALCVLVSLPLLSLFGPTSFNQGLILIGLVLLLFGIWRIRAVIKSNPGDQDYDDWLAYQASQEHIVQLTSMKVSSPMMYGICIVSSHPVQVWRAITVIK